MTTLFFPLKTERRARKVFRVFKAFRVSRVKKVTTALLPTLVQTVTGGLAKPTWA